MKRFEAVIKSPTSYDANVVIAAETYNQAQMLLEAQYGKDRVGFIRDMYIDPEHDAAEAVRANRVEQARRDEEARKDALRADWNSRKEEVVIRSEGGASSSIDNITFDTSSSLTLRLVAAIPAFLLMTSAKGVGVGLFAAVVAFAWPGIVLLIAAAMLIGAVSKFWSAHSWYEIFVYPVVAIAAAVTCGPWLLSKLEESNKETGAAPSVEE